ncbi:hypothetical protein F7725_007779, partial [Dissostichus mawsoni]
NVCVFSCVYQPEGQVEGDVDGPQSSCDGIQQTHLLCVELPALTVFAHSEGSDSGSVLHPPHLQDPSARRVDDQEQSMASGSLVIFLFFLLTFPHADGHAPCQVQQRDPTKVIRHSGQRVAGGQTDGLAMTTGVWETKSESEQGDRDTTQSCSQGALCSVGSSSTCRVKRTVIVAFLLLGQEAEDVDVIGRGRSPKPIVVNVTKEKYKPSMYDQPSCHINTKGGRTKWTSTPQRRNIAVQKLAQVLGSATEELSQLTYPGKT